jgi:hypothetical protein
MGVLAKDSGAHDPMSFKVVVTKARARCTEELQALRPVVCLHRVDHGSIFVDRDGEHFGNVLEYM